MDEQTSQFGTRFLLDEDQVFNYNAWDNVEMDSGTIQRLNQLIQEQALHKVCNIVATDLMQNSPLHWDKFYDRHESAFFKDRKWLIREFPQLFLTNDSQQKDVMTIFEAGCGCGNSMATLIQHYFSHNLQQQNHIHFQQVKLVGCDYSQSAIDIIRSKQDYDERIFRAFQHDITRPVPPSQQGPNSVQYALMIFVLSAIEPLKQQQALQNMFDILRPGGQLFLRDYGRYDLTQVRFKRGRMISDGHYCRGDGTQVSFFDLDRLNAMAEAVGFVVVKSTVDRRLLVNRAKKLKMYRVWVQCQWQKPS